MENHHCKQQTKILSINISCCDRCPELLKKKILKIPGVDSIDIDMKNDLVYVTGTVDPMFLLNTVGKYGRSVQLLPDNHSKNKQNQNNCRRKRVVEKEEQHICEAYEPPRVDDRICRDFYCKVHPRSRSIVDKVSSSSLFGGGGRFGSYSSPPYVYSQPPPFLGHRYNPTPPPQFRPPRMLQRPFYFE